MFFVQLVPRNALNHGPGTTKKETREMMEGSRGGWLYVATRANPGKPLALFDYVKSVYSS